MSFDECLQLLAETFPVEEPEVSVTDCFGTPTLRKGPKTDFKFVFVQQNSPTCLDTNVESMMSPEQLAVPPDPLTPPTQTMSPDLEQTWMEILSLPELQVEGICVYTYLSVQGFDRTIDQRM